MGVKPARIEVHIEELVLEGFPGRDKEAIAMALQSRLAGLLEQRDTSLEIAGKAGIDSLAVDSIRLAPGARPNIVGTRVAETVYRGMIK